MELRCEVNEIVGRETLAVIRGRLGGKGLGGRIPLAGHGSLFDGTFFKGPHGLTRFAIQDVQERLLRTLRDHLHRPAVDGHVAQNRRAWIVVVPNAVMNELVVPAAGAGFQIQSDQAVAEQAVTWTRAAIVVSGRHLDSHVNQAELLIDGALAPGSGVAGVRPGIVQPRVESELSRPGDGVEDPFSGTGADVITAHETFDVGLADGNSSVLARGSHDDSVLADNGRRLETDLLTQRLDFLIVVGFEIHDAVHAESWDPSARAGIERNHAVAWGHKNDAIFGAIGPVRQPASG